MLKIDIRKIENYEDEYLDDISYESILKKINNTDFANESIKNYLLYKDKKVDNLKTILIGHIDDLEKVIEEFDKYFSSLFNEYKLCEFLLSTDIDDEKKIKSILNDLRFKIDDEQLGFLKAKQGRENYIKEKFPDTCLLIDSTKINNEEYKNYLISILKNFNYTLDGANIDEIKHALNDVSNKYVLCDFLLNTSKISIDTIKFNLNKLNLNLLDYAKIIDDDGKFSKTIAENYIRDDKTLKYYYQILKDKDKIEEIFAYKKIKSELRHKILTKIDINVCPYCGRQFITSYKTDYNTQKSTADLDHFYIKSKYPYLALSLYNFVPSCQICNSRMKLSKDFYIYKHLYPYKDGFNNDVVFDIDNSSLITDLISNPDKVNIVINVNENADEEKKNKIDNNIDTFKLDLLYENHSKDVKDLLRNIQIYSESYIKDIVDVLYGDDSESDLKKRELAYRAQELSKVVFREKKEDEILAKLHNDILNKYWKK